MCKLVGFTVSKLVLGNLEVNDTNNWKWNVTLVIMNVFDMLMGLLFVLVFNNMVTMFAFLKVKNQDKLKHILTRKERIWKLFLAFEILVMFIIQTGNCYFAFKKKLDPDKQAIDLSFMTVIFILRLMKAVVDITYVLCHLLIIYMYR